MSADRHGEWSLTYPTGTAFYLLDPRPEEIFIADIAHALSNICRFGGHTAWHYSVAQHSYYVSWHVSRENALWGLLHDASEAYLGDMIRPLKHDGSDFADGYRQAERRVQQAICDRFGLSYSEPPEVKQTDSRLLVTERNCLQPATPKPFGAAQGLGEPLPITIAEWDPDIAEGRFLNRFHALYGGANV